jgi:uncharacterized protein
MGHTTYDSTIKVLQGILQTLSHILHKAEKHAGADTDANALLTARLTDDMYPLADQIRLATQFAERVTARLTGGESRSFGGNPASLADCHERIEMALRAANEADRDEVNKNGDEIKSTTLVPGQDPVDMSGGVYAHIAALPNIYFHAVTAYGILRKEGVPLGKRDYYAGFFPAPASGTAAS